MRILQVSFENPFSFTGAGLEGVIFNLCNHFSNMENVNVDVVYMSDKNYVRKIDKGLLYGIAIPRFSFIKKGNILIRKYFYNKKLKSFVITHRARYDVIHLHGDIGGFKKIKNTKIVTTFHGFSRFNPHYKGFFHRLAFFFFPRYEVNNANNSDVITAVSQSVKDIIKKYTKKQVDVIYNGVDSAKYKPISHEEKVKLRQELGLLPESFNILFIGKDPLRKGLEKAIEIAEQFNGEEVSLNVIGLTSYKTSAKNIYFRGVVSEELKIKYLQASDALILPSKKEGFGLVVLEGMSCGIIPMISGNTGAQEIINPGSNGFVSIKNTPDDYIEFLRLMLSNKRKAELICEAARETAVKYDWDSISRTYYDIYAQLIKGI